MNGRLSGLRDCLPDAGQVRLILAGAAGIFLGHPNPLVHLPLLALATPPALFLLALRSASARQALFLGWLTTLAGQTPALYWLILPITQIGGLPLPLALLCLLLLNAFLALFAGLLCLIMRQAQRVFSSSPGIPSLSLPAALAGGAAWSGCEILTGFLFTGFPWLVLNAAFAPWPSWIQAAALVGGYGLSALYASGSCLLACVRSGPNRLPVLGMGLALCLGPPLLGVLRLAESSAAAQNHPLTVLLIQGNIDQNQKWEPSFQWTAVGKYASLSRQAIAQATQRTEGVDLVLWPETAMPFAFQPQGSDTLSDALRNFSRSINTPLAFGVLGVTGAGPQGRRFFNRAQFLSASGEELGHYDKEHLVPFGEYIPLSANFDFLQRILQGADFSPGRNAGSLLLPRTPLRQGNVSSAGGLERGDTALGMLICYEAIFPELARQRVADGAEVLVSISNDAWFGATSAPRQHLHLAAMRAVEQGRPLVRATNTGYTAVIDAFGRIVEESQLFTEAVITARVIPSSETTLYYKLHPFLRAGLPVCVLLLLLPFRFRREGRNHS
ncbi:MAG: apolipoprotein N-acyltransferase [Desulfovibrio sp.]|jgi:apolipoprotein N-acyltransferase|nr:apolipoprotein N-acyltransferase [Desulfovibrio sp.]